MLVFLYQGIIQRVKKGTKMEGGQIFDSLAGAGCISNSVWMMMVGSLSQSILTPLNHTVYVSVHVTFKEMFNGCNQF